MFIVYFSYLLSVTLLVLSPIILEGHYDFRNFKLIMLLTIYIHDSFHSSTMCLCITLNSDFFSTPERYEINMPLDNKEYLSGNLFFPFWSLDQQCMQGLFLSALRGHFWWAQRIIWDYRDRTWVKLCVRQMSYLLYQSNPNITPFL